MKKIYWNIVSILLKTFQIYVVFLISTYMILLCFPKISEDIIKVSQTIQNYKQYTKPAHIQKVKLYTEIAEGYVADFYNDTRFLNYDKSIKPRIYVFPRSSLYAKSTEYNAIAFCNLDSGNVIILTDDNFDNQFFHNKSFLAKSVIYHELGHCILKLKHKDDNYNIMNANVDKTNDVFNRVNMWSYLSQINMFGKSFNPEMQKIDISNEDLNYMVESSRNVNNIFSWTDIKTTAIMNLMEVDPLFRKMNGTALEYRIKLEDKWLDNK